MKSYETIKQELTARRNAKGFTKAFYKQFVHDMDVIREAVEECNRLNIDISVTDFWRNSETHKSWFYKHNSGAYCEMLQICE